MLDNCFFLRDVAKFENDHDVVIIVLDRAGREISNPRWDEVKNEFRTSQKIVSIQEERKKLAEYKSLNDHAMFMSAGECRLTEPGSMMRTRKSTEEEKSEYKRCCRK